MEMKDVTLTDDDCHQHDNKPDNDSVPDNGCKFNDDGIDNQNDKDNDSAVIQKSFANWNSSSLVISKPLQPKSGKESGRNRRNRDAMQVGKPGSCTTLLLLSVFRMNCTFSAQ